MRAVVTGASGFLGSSLVRTLLENNCEVLAIVRPNSHNRNRIHENSKLRLMEIDISEINRISQIVHDKYDVFFHLAWCGIRGSERNNYLLQRENYKNSCFALQTACELGCEKFVVSGSQAECGPSIEKISESTPFIPVCEYGKAKRDVYNYSINFCEKNNISLIWTRIFSLYGIYDYHNSLINYAINNLMRNMPLLLTNCEQFWDYMYVDDAARAIFMSAICENFNGVINIANGESKRLKQYIYDMKRIVDSNSEICFGAKEQRSNPVNLLPDVSLLRNLIGFRPEIDFESGIRKIISYKTKGNE